MSNSNEKDLHRVLAEFANRVGLISSLERGGKLSSEEAYAELRELWRKLKNSESAQVARSADKKVG